MFAGADWSGESFRQAQQDVDRLWDDTRRDVETSPFLDGQEAPPADAEGQRRGEGADR
jgi:hypothetical protein